MSVENFRLFGSAMTATLPRFAELDPNLRVPDDIRPFYHTMLRDLTSVCARMKEDEAATRQSTPLYRQGFTLGNYQPGNGGKVIPCRLRRSGGLCNAANQAELKRWTRSIKIGWSNNTRDTYITFCWWNALIERDTVATFDRIAYATDDDEEDFAYEEEEEEESQGMDT